MVEVSWVSFGRIERGLRVLDGFLMGLHGFWWVLARFWEFWGEKKKLPWNLHNICARRHAMQHKDLWLQVRRPANLKNILPNVSTAAEYSLDSISGYLST